MHDDTPAPPYPRTADPRRGSINADPGSLILSPSTLNDYLACRHLATLDRADLVESDGEASMADLTRDRGLAHERAYLETLRASGLTIAELAFPNPDTASLHAAETETVDAMRSGVDVIYQANFFDGTWRGHADFLRRVETPSDLGAWSYEPVDTKLAKSVKTSAILQLCSYAQHITRIQGVAPEHLRVVTGDTKEHFESFRDYESYFSAVRDEYLVWRAQRDDPTTGSDEETYPEKVEHCSVCIWTAQCEQRRRDDDHLALVAGLRKTQAVKMRTVGITTVEDLGTTTVTSVPGIGGATFDRLRDQARLQISERTTGTRIAEVLPPAGDPDAPASERTGLALLPEPSPHDVFFDMEGDPFVTETGLEYLFGLVTVDTGSPLFTAYWAHDRSAERVAFEKTIDFIIERFDRDPSMHVFHYAPYETTALAKLMGRHGTREVELDRLLRAGVFVDLYRVVRRSVLVSGESYSIKQLEPLYMPKREGAIGDAGSSVVAYERWLESGDQTELDDIAAYNEDDCVSTWLLRNWLEEKRTEFAAVYDDLERPILGDGTASPTVTDEETATAAVADSLRSRAAAIPPCDSSDGDDQASVGPSDAERDRGAYALLADVLSYHRRESKSAYFWFFRRQEMDLDELYEDHEAISGLEFIEVVEQVKRSLIRRYRFDPDQEYKLRLDSGASDRFGRSAGTVVAIDADAGTIDLKRAITAGDYHPDALLPEGPVNDTAMRAALRRIGEDLAANGTEGTRYAAAAHLLRRDGPGFIRSAGWLPGAPLAKGGEHGTDAARRLAPDLDRSMLAIQGPPGAGKTYTGAHTIVDLVVGGKCVGITALSHKHIANLIEAVLREAEKRGESVRVIQKCTDEQRADHPDVRATTDNKVVETAAATRAVDVVGGTAWLFSRDAMEATLDYLFVDEAAQLALANVLASSVAATNVVLLGDPQQLTQPSQGSHPDGVDTSGLAHLLDTHETIPPDLGLFLEESHRMHPGVCSFISALAYESRLGSTDECARQDLDPAGTGLRFVAVHHEGNTTSSSEEATEVAAIIKELLGQTWTDQQGDERAVTADDILVVTPFNMQVGVLRSTVPPAIQVGTVDKFQGREAPVVIYSMASSTGEDVPRGLDFLYDLHRFNVAISRAQGAVFVVASPALLTPRVRSLNQMKSVNAFCRYVEAAQA